jgi:uncharacterized membrane protein YjfL (UPF0719 family)
MPDNIMEILIWGTLGLITLYLIFQRIKEKKKEDFEDRDN